MTTTHSTTLGKIGLTISLALSISAMASSSGFAYSARAQQMCTGDAFRLCSSEIPNIARITACILRNKANLSPGCRAVVDQEMAARARPPQPAPAEHKPPVVTRTEPPAPTRPPVQAAPVAPTPSVAPVVAAPAPAPVATAPAIAPLVPPPAAVEANPVEAVAHRNAVPAGSSEWAGTKAVHAAQVEAAPTVAGAGDQSPTTEAKPVQAAPIEPGPVVAAPVAQSTATEMTPAPVAPVVQTPTEVTPAAPSRAGESKPVQPTAVEQRTAVAAPVDPKPVTAAPAPAGKPVKAARRKHRQNRVNVAGYGQGGFDIDQAIGFAIPILGMMLSW